jgi:hypothetical protein
VNRTAAAQGGGEGLAKKEILGKILGGIGFHLLHLQRLFNRGFDKGLPLADRFSWAIPADIQIN